MINLTYFIPSSYLKDSHISLIFIPFISVSYLEDESDFLCKKTSTYIVAIAKLSSVSNYYNRKGKIFAMKIFFLIFEYKR